MADTNIKELTVEQLKGLIYDQIVIFNTAQRNIQMLEAELVSRNKPEPNVTLVSEPKE